MQNKDLAHAFKLTGQLMELHGENPFKIRSYSNAAFRIGRLDQQLSNVSYDDLESIDGIGKSVAAKIVELLETGSMQFLEGMVAKTPVGVIDMMSIKGIGPKKIATIWKDLGVESVGELLYACNENRLVELKGFGAKTQEQIKKMIEFRLSNEGLFHFAAIEGLANDLLEELRTLLPNIRVELAGQVRRKCEVVDTITLLVGDASVELPELTTGEIPVRVEVLQCPAENFAWHWLQHSADPAHLSKLNWENEPSAADEAAIYQANGHPYIVPEMREGRSEFEWAARHSTDDLLTLENLKGSLHNHSTWSDGRHSLKEMAVYCRDMGLTYLGICDHSRAAFYANGLSAERVAEQQAEIDRLNVELAPFKIFKGIESDILNDGSLDYEAPVLASFDFIVASVHSNLKMDREKATNRLLTAIENPYTTILGHPTGRLLLSREGYPIHHEAIIDACAANGVVIELNANPLRLDLDWRWVDYAQNKGVMISINPDAHHTDGFHHHRYGVFAARKGGLLRANTFNTLSTQELEAYFIQRKA